jgi:Autotransporter beta-domain
VRAAWEHEYAYSALPISANLVDIPGPPVTGDGPSLGHDSAVVNAGVAMQWTRSFSTYVSYDGQLGRARCNSNGVSADFGFHFEAHEMVLGGEPYFRQPLRRSSKPSWGSKRRIAVWRRSYGDAGDQPKAARPSRCAGFFTTNRFLKKCCKR